MLRERTQNDYKGKIKRTRKSWEKRDNARKSRSKEEREAS